MQQLGSNFGGIWGGPAVVLQTLTNRFNSEVSTRDTVRVMARLAHEYSTHPFVVGATQHALTERVGSERDIACAIFRWARSKVHFVYDETLLYEQLGVAPEDLDTELLIVPPLLLRMRPPQGDCDDFSLLIASMLLCARMRPYFVTVAADKAEPMKFSHIYVAVELRDEGSHMALDAGNRLRGVQPGWELPTVTRKAIWRI